MEYNTPEFRKWLDKLQQESWQLELIISGFAIYGLFTAIDPIDIRSEIAYVNGNIYLAFIWVIASMALYILLFNLVLHVLLRGLWIGAIGLRYVSGDIDYESLNYSTKFTSFLKRKVGSFDRYIARLENYCSILFSISFLLIFYVIGAFVALFLVGLLFGMVPEIFENSGKLVKFAVLFLMIIFCLSAILVFLDFLGQGFLKRKRWTSVIYFPIYRFFGFITLSFLYRPLIYNFLDNKFGKRLSILLVPIYITIIFLSSMEYSKSNYLETGKDSSEFYSANKHYEDLSAQEDTFIEIAAIPSKVIETNYLKVFLLYREEMEDFIFEIDENLKTKEDKRGYYSKLFSEFRRGMDMAAGKIDSIDTAKYLETTDKLYQIKIDSNVYESNFVVSTNSKERLGFETYLNIKNLEEGKNILTIEGPAKPDFSDSESKTITKTLVTIPFWYFPKNAWSISKLKDSAVAPIAIK